VNEADLAELHSSALKSVVEGLMEGVPPSHMVITCALTMAYAINAMENPEVIKVILAHSRKLTANTLKQMPPGCVAQCAAATRLVNVDAAGNA